MIAPEIVLSEGALAGKVGTLIDIHRELQVRNKRGYFTLSCVIGEGNAKASTIVNVPAVEKEEEFVEAVFGLGLPVVAYRSGDVGQAIMIVNPHLISNTKVTRYLYHDGEGKLKPYPGEDIGKFDSVMVNSGGDGKSIGEKAVIEGKTIDGKHFEAELTYVYPDSHSTK